MAIDNNSPPPKMSIKDKLETIKSIVTIIAVLVGAAWTYILFVKERQHFPHAGIEQNISHVALSRDTNLLRVAITLSNMGTSRLLAANSIIRVQQIIPIPSCPKQGPCAKEEVNIATKDIIRRENSFSWPLLSERVNGFTPPLDIEPGEKDFIEYEFVVSNDVKVVRIYSYFRNDRRSTGEVELGWSISSYYDFRNAKSEGVK